MDCGLSILLTTPCHPLLLCSLPHFFYIHPGTGKSTILNGLVDSPKFNSGMSITTGLTETLQRCDLDGISYFDTPGLNDVDKRKQAGAEIDKLLRIDVSINTRLRCYRSQWPCTTARCRHNRTCS